MPVLVCAEAGRIAPGARIVVDVEGGRVTVPETGESFPADALTGHLLAMLQAGGLVPYLERRMGAEGEAAQVGG